MSAPQGQCDGRSGRPGMVRAGRCGGGIAWVALFGALVLTAGCAASRSDLNGAFLGEPPPRGPTDPVSIAFIFTHTHQEKGWDVIPKLHDPNRFANGFYDLFRDALPEITNVGAYATFTDRADDVTDPERRAQRDSLASGSHDFTVHMRFMRETSFAHQALGTLFSTLTLTALPIPFTRRYSVTADVSDRAGRLLKRYERDAKVTLWVEALLIFAFPFHPETRKTEEVYLEFLHNVFREVEADGILVPHS